jgi:alkanesulfonate monooxygenase SsuD/methylene tetrahydromethanopterin reductase-like flavin-dependent oxidoreductase (luciferase family)
MPESKNPKELKFGIWFPPAPSWPVLRERTRLVEQLGFESIWMVDHFVNPYDCDCPWMDGWSLLAAMAGCTERVRVGTLVTNIIYRLPAVIAKQALTVDHISGGRLTLGIGVGSPRDLSHPMTGVDPWPVAERVSRFEEIVTILDQMLRSPVTTYTGQYYKVTEATMLPPPIQQPRPPLLIAAEGRRMLKIAASFADNWNCISNFQYSSDESLQHIHDNNQRLTELAIELGRDPNSITRSFCVGWTNDQPFESLGAFQDFIGCYAEVGIQQFMLGYWEDTDGPPTSPMTHINNLAMLERIAQLVTQS